jgi:hypothetical protein
MLLEVIAVSPKTPSLLPDTATDILTVLTILLFALMVEYFRIARARKWRGLGGFIVRALPILTAVSYLASAFFLLEVVNFGPYYGYTAQLIFYVTVFTVVMLFWNLILLGGSALRSERGNTANLSRTRPRIRPGLATRRRARG